MLPAVCLTMYLTLLALPCCEPTDDDREFNKSVLLLDGDLPKYTEYGYNMAGAKITTVNRHRTLEQVWRLFSYNYSGIADARISKAGDGMLRFSLMGYKTPDNVMEILFDFRSEMPNSLTGLQELLAGQKFSSQQGTLLVELPSGDENFGNGLNVTSASLHFIRSRNIYADSNERRGVSLSGTFEFAGTFIENGENVSITVSSGRFDILFSSSYGDNSIEFSNIL